MKKVIPLFIFVLIFNLFAQENNWEVIWKMEQLPFMDPQQPSEMAIVKAGLDTDEDGWGEFLCAWTDSPENYVVMYEATGDNQFELVWWFKIPIAINTFIGITVGDIDNSGLVELIITAPAVVGTDPNPPRLWTFEWSGNIGENKYGKYNGDVAEPSSSWNFNVEDNTDFRPYSLQVEDIDNDGMNELIAGVRQSGRGREVIVASVNGQLTGFGFWEVEYNFAQTFGGSLYSVTTGDLDNDSNQEIYALIWNYFTMRIFEYNGTTYDITTELDEIYKDQNIDYGAVDAVRVADVNNDGVKELYIAGTEPQNTLFIITDVNDVTQITADDVKELLSIPQINVGKFRSMQVADPDHDGNLSLMIAGEGNGQIYDIEYKGTGDPASAESWDVNVIFDVWEYAGFSPTADPTLTPRFFYGHPASDMDKDGKDEYLFVNYSSDFSLYPEDVYVWMIEIDKAVSVEENVTLAPNKFELMQNFPNPFNPSTSIEYSVQGNEFVSLKVYDVLGNEISTLVNETKSPGTYKVNFDASQLTSGIYFYKMTAGNFTKTNKMMLVK